MDCDGFDVSQSKISSSLRWLIQAIFRESGALIEGDRGKMGHQE
jgi:hypothetical protein